MKPITRVVILLASLLGFAGGALAADAPDATATIDKAIKAMGGQEKLGAMKAASISLKGKLTINGNDSDFTMAMAFGGLDHIRQEFQATIDGNEIKDLRVIAGDKAWHKNADGVDQLDDGQANGLRRTAYLAIVATNPALLKDKAFKIGSAAEEQAGGKPVVSVKIVGPDEKDFTISFDKESGLPVKSVGKVLSYNGNEVTQETTYDDYKETNGIKKAMHATMSHDGEKLLDEHVTEFKLMDDKAADEAFAEPK
jgi:hypothetical protein